MGQDCQLADGEGAGEDSQGKSGTGAGDSHTWDETEGGPEGGKHADDWRMSEETSEWEEEFEDLYDAQRLQDTETLLTSLEGEMNPDGHIDTMPIRLLPGDGEQVGAPTLNVPEAYREAAADALEDEQIPPGYRDQVKKYFDSVQGDP